MKVGQPSVLPRSRCVSSQTFSSAGKLVAEGKSSNSSYISAPKQKHLVALLKTLGAWELKRDHLQQAFKNGANRSCIWAIRLSKNGNYLMVLHSVFFSISCTQKLKSDQIGVQSKTLHSPYVYHTWYVISVPLSFRQDLS